MLRIGLLISLALCISIAQAQQLYKWVDAEGNMQFSNQPPPQDAEAETLELDVTAPLQSAEPAAEETSENDTQATDGNEGGMTPEQLRQNNCNVARRNQALFSSSEKLMIKHDDGKMYKITEEERQARLAEAQKHVDHYCEPVATEETPAEQATQ
jgi:hypothetical protein